MSLTEGHSHDECRNGEEQRHQKVKDQSPLLFSGNFLCPFAQGLGLDQRCFENLIDIIRECGQEGTNRIRPLRDVFDGGPSDVSRRRPSGDGAGEGKWCEGRNLALLLEKCEVVVQLASAVSTSQTTAAITPQEIREHQKPTPPPLTIYSPAKHSINLNLNLPLGNAGRRVISLLFAFRRISLVPHCGVRILDFNDCGFITDTLDHLHQSIFRDFISIEVDSGGCIEN